ncbi:CynX/NimT family MFS transporter [Naasia sp. SYSU D00948]|uniref:MFS transporter n=1 Tax=Naasia sp. SYSU D00948 TaxID=2817379 RepID=UPI001B30DB0C|nr:MFS transporter [Naasia sp. SYSU D00948]
MTSASRSAAERPRGPLPEAAAPGLFLVALLLAAVNLRGPFVAVAPVAGEIRAEFGISAAEVGLLTSIPVLCFGLAAPLALLVIRRVGAELAVLVCLVGIIAGAAIRSAGPFWLAIAGTVVIGLAITVGNVVVPVLIRRDVRPGRVGLATGGYNSMLNIGAMVVSLGTAPLAAVLGWRGALLAWLTLTVLGTAAWLVFLRRRPPTVREDSAPAEHAVVWRRPLAWLLALAFAGQATSYYGITAWLPSLLADERGFTASEAGVSSSFFQMFAVLGAIGMPLLVMRIPAWAAISLVGALWCSLPIGLLLAPELFLLFCALGGVAQGAGFTAVFTVIAATAGNARQTAALSAFVQGVGYVAAALSPPALGLAHDLTGGWTAPLLIVVGTTLCFGVFGVAAALRGAHLRTP